VSVPSFRACHVGREFHEPARRVRETGARARAHTRAHARARVFLGARRVRARARPRPETHGRPPLRPPPALSGRSAKGANFLS